MGGESRSRAEAGSYPKLFEHPVGQRITNIYKDRLAQFNDGGQYSSQNLQSVLWQGRVSGEPAVKLEVYSPPNLARPLFKDAIKEAKWTSTKKGESFGPSWSTHWFRITITVPSDLQSKDHLEFHWDAGNEGLVYNESGNPLQGLTGGGERIEWILPKDWYDGKEHLFYIEMACNKMFGNAGGDSIQPPNPNNYFNLGTADIVAVNLQVRALSVDFWIIGDAAREFPQDGWEAHEALNVCTAIMNTFYEGKGSQDAILKAREIARTYIGNVDSAKVYESGKTPLVHGIGHCHIDTCWLWPWDETKRKCARSWASQCELLDRYPEHRFTVSQAQQYQWLEMYYPTLFDRIKEHVKKGTFLPIGGSWVEHDTNMPSGESLVRQFLYGQRFFESHFGERCTTFWLPDTFGYSAQLPQLCRLSGMNRFFTQKLSWNNINKFPHTTFNWVSLDGSQVICHMAPSETYTAEAHFGDVRRSITQHKSLDQDKTSLLVFGKGDGGGGPTYTQIEKLRRCRGIADTTGLLPRVHMGNTVDDFFAKLEERIENGLKLTTWWGELYFELHRGTYTTQANNKWNNRKTEILMRDVEFLATLATLKDSNYKYPKKDIDFMWEGILLCQFHDCLPGSSIEMCYDDSDKLYAEIFKTGEKLLKEILSVLGYALSENPTSNDKLFALNLLPWNRGEIVKVPGADDKLALVQGNQGALGAQELSKSSKSTVSINKAPSGIYILSNENLEVHVEQGLITLLYDKKAGRQILREGEVANQYVVFDDKPLYWQAWDVEVYSLDSRQVLTNDETEIGESGPHRVSVVTKTTISDKSWIKTTLSLTAAVDGEPSYVEVASEVEWQETMKFLKVEFPVDVVNTEASYETQYGIIRRPTHYNTSWDMAKFEVCCHKWADLSENGYGVSILNDSKYGFATWGNLMRLSLLRAPKAPDAHADMGRHNIRFAIFPHQGPLDSRTIRAGYNFNHPMRLVESIDDSCDPTYLNAISLTGNPSLVLDCIKRGEDDEDVSRGELPQRKGRSIILRIYDSLGGTSRGTITWDDELVNVKKVYKTNALEDDEDSIEFTGQGADISLRPFEVATFRLQL